MSNPPLTKLQLKLLEKEKEREKQNLNVDLSVKTVEPEPVQIRSTPTSVEFKHNSVKTVEPEPAQIHITPISVEFKPKTGNSTWHSDPVSTKSGVKPTPVIQVNEDSKKDETDDKGCLNGFFSCCKTKPPPKRETPVGQSNDDVSKAE